jgi:hypothetical protein
MLRFFLYRTPVLILTLYIKTTQSATPQLALIPTSEEGGLRALAWSSGKSASMLSLQFLPGDPPGPNVLLQVGWRSGIMPGNDLQPGARPSSSLADQINGGSPSRWR